MNWDALREVAAILDLPDDVDSYKSEVETGNARSPANLDSLFKHLWPNFLYMKELFKDVYVSVASRMNLPPGSVEEFLNP